MLRGIILVVHVSLALMIIGLVLLQRGKGAEAGAGFGAGASGTVFGARGTSTLFSKLTAVFAALFFATSLTLAYLGTQPSNAPTQRARARRRRNDRGCARPPRTTAPACRGNARQAARRPPREPVPAAPGAPARLAARRSRERFCRCNDHEPTWRNW